MVTDVNIENSTQDPDAAACLAMRQTIFRTAVSGGMGHLASCFSSVEILYTLYMKGILRYDAKDPWAPERDRFILSKGHAGLCLYTALSMAGFFEKEKLDGYLKEGCFVGGEPLRGELPGVEASTGALGHGLSFALGVAMALKLDGSDAKVYALIGDGESEEGSIWEAAMAAPAFSADNLVVILDHNELQKSARVDETLHIREWRSKWESFGWHVVETDGHDVGALCETFRSIEGWDGPTLVIAHTIKGKGVSIMEQNPIWHFKLPNRKETKVFLSELQLENAVTE